MASILFREKFYFFLHREKSYFFPGKILFYSGFFSIFYRVFFYFLRVETVDI